MVIYLLQYSTVTYSTSYTVDPSNIAHSCSFGDNQMASKNVTAVKNALQKPLFKVDLFTVELYLWLAFC